MASSNLLSNVLISRAKYGTCSKIITNFFLSKWRSDFMSLPTCRQTKLFYNEMCPEKAQSVLLLSRSELGRMVQFLSGHGYWAKHLALCNNSNQDFPTTQTGDGLCQE